MTPTPRTDAHIRANTGNGTQYVSADFARILERENAELNDRLIDRQETLMETLIENQNLRRILLMSTNKLALACSRCGNEMIN